MVSFRFQDQEKHAHTHPPTTLSKKSSLVTFKRAHPDPFVYVNMILAGRNEGPGETCQLVATSRKNVNLNYASKFIGYAI